MGNLRNNQITQNRRILTPDNVENQSAQIKSVYGNFGIAYLIIVILLFNPAFCDLCTSFLLESSWNFGVLLEFRGHDPEILLRQNPVMSPISPEIPNFHDLLPIRCPRNSRGLRISSKSAKRGFFFAIPPRIML